MRWTLTACYWLQNYTDRKWWGFTGSSNYSHHFRLHYFTRTNHHFTDLSNCKPPARGSNLYIHQHRYRASVQALILLFRTKHTFSGKTKVGVLVTAGISNEHIRISPWLLTKQSQAALAKSFLTIIIWFILTSITCQPILAPGALSAWHCPSDTLRWWHRAPSSPCWSRCSGTSAVLSQIEKFNQILRIFGFWKWN